MPRYARVESESGIYHIMVRGINRDRILLSDEDRNRFIQILYKTKEKAKYKLYAYCLMDNHVHFLMKEMQEPAAITMKRILVSYVYYFNHKYQRVGHLFQDRYRSEAIEEDSYFLAVVRYIHNNPLKAGLAPSVGEYQWSSYTFYSTVQKSGSDLVDTEMILGMFSEDKEKGIELFKEYSKKDSTSEFIDVEKDHQLIALPDGNMIVDQLLEEHEINKERLREVRDKRKRDQILNEVKRSSGISNRELSKILGISKDIITRA